MNKNTLNLSKLACYPNLNNCALPRQPKVEEGGDKREEGSGTLEEGCGRWEVGKGKWKEGRGKRK